MGKKYIRKRYFINPHLQMRLLLTFAIPMLTLILFIAIVMFFTTRSIVNSAAVHIGDEFHNIIRSKQLHISDPAKRYQETVKRLEEYVGNLRIKESGEFTANLLRSASKVLALGLLIVVFQLVILTIFVSHKIAGPIYRFEKFCEAIQTGDLTTRIRLRKSDEMIQTAERFNVMTSELEIRIRTVQEALEEMPQKAGQESLQKARDAIGHFKTS